MVVDNITTCHVSKPVSYILISTTTTTTTTTTAATTTTNSSDAESEGETERHKTTINFSYLLNFSCVFLEKRLTYDCESQSQKNIGLRILIHLHLWAAMIACPFWVATMCRVSSYLICYQSKVF
ncbi:hypothetical protein GQX74_012981 [Glossina fuscipes]|nr:hypothetical protein GQX74_012981 [Glossina fuscipes]